MLKLTLVHRYTLQCLFKVRNDVADMLDSDRDLHIVRQDLFVYDPRSHTRIKSGVTPESSLSFPVNC